MHTEMNAVIIAAMSSVLADAETVRLFPAAFDAGDDDGSEAVREYNDACAAAEGALESLCDAIAGVRRSIDRSSDWREASLAVRSAIASALASDVPPGTRAAFALASAV